MFKITFTKKDNRGMYHHCVIESNTVNKYRLSYDGNGIYIARRLETNDIANSNLMFDFIKQYIEEGSITILEKPTSNV